MPIEIVPQKKFIEINLLKKKDKHTKSHERKIIVYFRSIINAYSSLSHEWLVPLIKFMVGPTIYVRGEYVFMVLREYLIICSWTMTS